MHPTLVLCCVALLCLTTASCGSAGDGSDTATRTPSAGASTTTSSSASASTSAGTAPPTASSGQPGGTTSPAPPKNRPTSQRGMLLEVTGTVSKGVESGCLLLSPASGEVGAGEEWLLVGETRGLVPGQVVTVRGARDDSVMTTCQQGLPFMVSEVLTTDS